MTLEAFYGEFTVSPVPLELSLNYCSHKCGYCFANLNNPKRTADMRSIVNLITKFNDRKSTAAMLLREGYPVLISNRVDPFATSNYQQALQLIRLLSEMGIGVAIQTKGGRGINEALDMLPPSCWYVSASFVDDRLRAKIEPGAPSIDERMELIETLTRRGHAVVLGLNPLVKQWLPDPKPLIKRAADAGAHGVWIEMLHLNKDQAAALSDRERRAITEPVIDQALGRAGDDEMQHFADARAYVQDLGLSVFSMNQGIASDIWAPYRKLYKKTFPTNQDFVNWSHDTIRPGAAVCFEDYWDVYGPRLPEGVHLIENYIRVPARALFLKHKIPSKMTYRQLLQIIWHEPNIWSSPARMECFAYAVNADQPDALLTDEDDQPWMAFSHIPITEMYQPVQIETLIGEGVD